MGSINVSTSFTRHPKALAAGPTARHLYLCSLMWSGEYDTNGAIPGYALPVLAADAGIPPDEAGASADRLVEVGLWERAPDGWVVHDWTEWQTSSDQRERRLEMARDRQRRYLTRQERVGDASLTEDVTRQAGIEELSLEDLKQERVHACAREGVTDASPTQDPPKPKKRRTQCPDDFQPDERRREWAKAERPDLDLAAETAIFVDFHQAKGNVYLDWQKAWQGWIRRARRQVAGRQVGAAGTSRLSNGQVISIDPGLQAQARGQSRGGS